MPQPASASVDASHELPDEPDLENTVRQESPQAPSNTLNDKSGHAAVGQTERESRTNNSMERRRGREGQSQRTLQDGRNATRAQSGLDSFHGTVQNLGGVSRDEREASRREVQSHAGAAATTRSMRADGGKGDSAAGMDNAPLLETAPDRAGRRGNVPKPSEAAANVPFSNVAARTPLVITDIHAARHRNWLCRQTSTRDDLLAWLCASRGQNYGPAGPVSHIYWIIRNDMVDLISLTNTIVDQVIIMSSDEEKVERNLPQWRSLISRLEAEYRRFEFQFRLLPRFFASGYSNHTSEPLYKQKSETSREQGLVDEIQVIRKRLTFALQALVSAVSVIESRRGIAEAESVTKLTELGELLGEMTYDCSLTLKAFLFIPVTFASSLFSMQVKELNPDTTSVRWFALTAVLVTVSSYSVRLLIRSRLMVEALRKMMNSVRTYAGLRERQPVPTVVFVRWAVTSPMRAFNSIGWWANFLRPNLPVILTCIFCGFIPLFSVWFNTHLRGGIKVAVSIAACITIIALLAVTAGRHLVHFLRDILRRPKRRRKGTRLR